MRSVSRLGCVSQDSDALFSQGRKFRGNPMQKVLEPIRTVRSTKSALTSCEYLGQERIIVGKN